ncbi:MAG: cation:proton antiporter [Nitrososphaerota archaeon]|nr:cation:proton antiporter [Nitrososphaerota archaeon]
MAAEQALSVQVSFILDIGILAVAALLFSIIFARLKLTIVSGQILAGVIVGPYVLNWVRDPVVLTEISGIGIVLLFFVIGLELDPAELGRLASRVTSLTLLEVGIAFAFGALASFLLHFDLLETIIFSMTASITSTAIVGKILLSRNMLKSQESGFLMGLLVVEDIIAIVFLVVLSSITSTGIGFPYITIGNGVAREFITVSEAVLSGFALIGLAYVTARYIAPRIINYLSYYEEEYEEIPFLFSLGLGFLFAVLAALLGYSPGIGAFVIGLSIRGKHSRFLEKRITPIKDLFLVLFFVSIGSLINPFPAFAVGLPIIAVFILLIAGKFSGGFVIGSILKAGQPKKSPEYKNMMNNAPDEIFSPRPIGTWLIPRGEFSLVIGQLGLTLGLVDQSFFSLIGVSVLVTAIIASILQTKIEPRRAPSDRPFRGKHDET